MDIFIPIFLCVLCGQQECQKKLDHKLSLDAYLLKPVQRITKYQLMLKVTAKSSLTTLIFFFFFKYTVGKILSIG